MYRFALLIVAVTLLTSSVAQAASYRRLGGAIVDPIMDTGGNPHSYSGNNLKSDADLTGADLTHAHLIWAKLYSADLTDANLTYANLWYAHLGYANLTNADLTGANLTDATLTNTILTAATLTGVSSGGIDGTPSDLPTNWQLTEGYLIGPEANLTNANLIYANLTDANLTNTILTGAILTGVRSGGITGNPSALPTNWQLTQGYLIGPGANLTGAALTGADLTNTILTNADLTGATLTNTILTAATLTGVRSGGITGNPSNLPPNWQLTQGYLIGPGANLTGAALTGANLTGAALTDANLTDATLLAATLTNTILTGANLTGAALTGAALTGADLTNTILTNADLTGATLTNTILTGATLTGANLHHALLPSAMPSLPVINGAVVKVVDTLAVTGSVQVDTGGNLWGLSNSFTAGAVNMQGGTVHGSIFGLDLDQIGNISGHGRLFGDVDLGTDGAIAGSGAGLTLYGDVSGSGTVSDATLFGNVNIGSSPGAITLEDVVMSEFATTTFEVAGTDPSQFDRLILVGSVALNGTARITFDNFTPELSDTFQLINLTGGTASSWFSSVVAPTGWTLSSGGLLAIPEPSSALLLGIGILCVAGYRRDSLV